MYYDADGNVLNNKVIYCRNGETSFVLNHVAYEEDNGKFYKLIEPTNWDGNVLNLDQEEISKEHYYKLATSLGFSIKKQNEALKAIEDKLRKRGLSKI